MTELFRLLALYYACDAIALERPLTRHETGLCMGHYEAVKDHFRPAHGDVGQANRAAYRAFKDWEQRNPDTVADLRARAAP